MKFMSGITMSPEDVARETQDRGDAAAADAASAAANGDTSGNATSAGLDGGVAAMASGREKGKDSNIHQHGNGSWSNNLRHRSGAASGHGQRNSDGAVIGNGDSSREVTTAHRAAEYEAQKTSPASDNEATQTTVPIGNGMLLPGIVTGSGSSPSLQPSSPAGGGGPPGAHNDRRESMQQPVLPIVEEAGENSSTGGRSRSSRFSNHTVESDGRPATPAKDDEVVAGGGRVGGGGGFGNAVLAQYAVRNKGGSSNGNSSSGGGGSTYTNSNSNNNNNSSNSGPPTPPATGYLKPESADSGYGVSGTRSRSGTLGSGRKVKMQMSRDSLDKELPPLPRLDGGAV